MRVMDAYFDIAQRRIIWIIVGCCSMAQGHRKRFDVCIMKDDAGTNREYFRETYYEIALCDVAQE